MEKIEIELKEHQRWRKENGSWGNGYIIIPKTHPLYMYADLKQNTWAPEGRGFYGDVIADEEITYHSWSEESYKIGFDTLHSNNGEHNTKEWVEKKCKAMISELLEEIDFEQIVLDVIDDLKEEIERWDEGRYTPYQFMKSLNRIVNI
jgi:hypothetical protein